MNEQLFAVPLTGESVYHAEGKGGWPACHSTSATPAIPVYVVDRDRRLHVLLVPTARRCSAAGCAERWGLGR